MTKVKKEKASTEAEEAAASGGTDRSYHELIANVNPIAQPLAPRKLSKKLYKCVKKGQCGAKRAPSGSARRHGTGRVYLAKRKWRRGWNRAVRVRYKLLFLQEAVSRVG